ncbi:cytochrome c oxidase assembly protein [Lentinula edodes]|uniref:Cytochrome c oxidase assembly protein n=1 Tax=Lentinula edodes TaxID=5353 RepID=A0A1Q3DZX5_LENED|nr:cytochrome c oxidase assembly protein [Lentinula edodes]
MSARAKITLGAAIIISSLTVWGVHFQQTQEREAMRSFWSLIMLPVIAGDASTWRLLQSGKFTSNDNRLRVYINGTVLLQPCSFGF